MSDIGSIHVFNSPVIEPLSFNSIATEMMAMFGAGGAFGTAAAWPSSNLAIFIPIKIGSLYIPTKMWWHNGATVGHNNADVGIYDTQGNRIFHSGSTAVSGASALQIVSVSNVALSRGIYYMAMAVNGTTDTFYFGQAPINAISARAMGILSVGTSFTLPATVTLAGSTTTYFPYIGMGVNTTV